MPFKDEGMLPVTQVLANCLCVLYPVISPSFGWPRVSNKTEVAPNEPRTSVQEVSEKVVNFFNPVTCRPKGNQAVAPCQAGEYINNKTLCLEHKCCVSSKKHAQLDCYTPLEDRPQQVLRMFCVGIGGVMIIAVLPFCCFIVEMSPCCNPLRRAPKEEDSEEESLESDESSDG